MDNSFVIGMDVGGTLVKSALVKENGEWIYGSEIASDIEKGTDDFLYRITRHIDKLKIKIAGLGSRILGVGVGIAGKILPGKGTVLFSPNLTPLNNYPFSKQLSKKTGLPVFIENDANAFGIGEKWLGSGVSYSNWLGITLGTGVGGVLILNDHLWSGDNLGFVGEIGHTIVFPDGPVCNCGKKGCLEAVSSGSALVKEAIKAIENNGMGKSTLYPSYVKGTLTPVAIDKAAASGDYLARSLFDQFGKGLGIAISNTFNLLGISTCIIGGGVSAAWPRFIDVVWNTLKEVNSMVDLDSTVIAKARLGNYAAVLGAAKLAWLRIKEKNH